MVKIAIFGHFWQLYVVIASQNNNLDGIFQYNNRVRKSYWLNMHKYIDVSLLRGSNDTQNIRKCSKRAIFGHFLPLNDVIASQNHNLDGILQYKNKVRKSY